MNPRIYILLFLLICIVVVGFLVAQYTTGKTTSFEEGFVNLEEWDIANMKEVHDKTVVDGQKLTIQDHEWMPYIEKLMELGLTYKKVTTTTAATGGETADFRSLGCYVDSDTPDKPRAMTFVGMVSSNAQCKDNATRGGYKMYGVQYGSQCFAGNDINKATAYGLSTGAFNDGKPCQLNGTGDPDKGGAWDHVLYSKLPAPTQTSKNRFDDYQNKVVVFLENKASTFDRINTLASFSELTSTKVFSISNFETMDTTEVNKENFTSQYTNVNGYTFLEGADHNLKPTEIRPHFSSQTNNPNVCKTACDRMGNYCQGFAFDTQGACFLKNTSLQGKDLTSNPNVNFYWKGSHAVPSQLSAAVVKPMNLVKNKQSIVSISGFQSDFMDDGKKEEGFTVMNTTDVYTRFMDPAVEYMKSNGGVNNNFLMKLETKYGLKTSQDYTQLVTDLAWLGVIHSKWTPWIVDCLGPYFGVNDANDLKKFRTMGSTYTAFGFGPPAEKLSNGQPDSQRFQRYIWYGVQLTKLGVGYQQMSDFARIHNAVFKIKMDMSVPGNASVGVSRDEDVPKFFDKDPFLQLMPAYVRLTQVGFKYTTATLFQQFCDTVNSFGAPTVAQKLMMFGDVLGQYDFGSFTNYTTFLTRVQNTVGPISAPGMPIHSAMSKIKDYIDTTSGLKPVAADKDTMYGLTASDKKTFKLSNGTEVPVFSYQWVNYLLDELQRNKNAYKVNNATGQSFENYIDTLKQRNWKISDIDKNVGYVDPRSKTGGKLYGDFMVKPEASAKLVFGSTAYDNKTDPYKKESFVSSIGASSSSFSSTSVVDDILEFFGDLFTWTADKDNEGSQIFETQYHLLMTEGYTPSDNEVLGNFGITNTNSQLEPVKQKFNAYGVTSFEEMIFHMNKMNENLKITSADVLADCLKNFSALKIDKVRLPNFVIYLKNAGFTGYSGDSGAQKFIEKMIKYDVNANAMNYKQFLFVCKRFGITFSDPAFHQRMFYATMDLLTKFQPSKTYKTAIVPKNKKRTIADQSSPFLNQAKESKLLRDMLKNMSYYKDNSFLQSMHRADRTPYNHYVFDNFVENFKLRGFTVDKYTMMMHPLVIPMDILHQSPQSVDVLPDLTEYVNENKCILPLTEHAKPMSKDDIINTYLFGKERGRLTGDGVFSGFKDFYQSNKKNMSEHDIMAHYTIVRVFTEMIPAIQDSEASPSTYKRRVYLANLFCFVDSEEELNAITGQTQNLSSLDRFSDNDHIIAYMFDLATTFERQQKEANVMNANKIQHNNYNDCVDTVNAIRLFPLLIFKRMCEYGKLNRQTVAQKGSGEKHVKTARTSKCHYDMITHVSKAAEATSYG